ncbi:MAG: crossover junction endodeoxyribonuclease RuvC [Rhodospirillales bacterium]|nr:crossover junction endodeoxyribonuclease RuvC [Rhodospirillales bacterium]
MEETFVNQNPASTLRIGPGPRQPSAVCALYGIEAAEYAANKVKKSIVGTCHAAIGQMGINDQNLTPVLWANQRG